MMMNSAASYASRHADGKATSISGGGCLTIVIHGSMSGSDGGSGSGSQNIGDTLLAAQWLCRDAFPSCRTAVLVSDRLPATQPFHAGLGLLSMADLTLVGFTGLTAGGKNATDNSLAALHLDVGALLRDQPPGTRIPLVVESMSGLLLRHDLSAVLSALRAAATTTTLLPPGCTLGPLILLVDSDAVGRRFLQAATSHAGLVLRVDSGGNTVAGSGSDARVLFEERSSAGRPRCYAQRFVRRPSNRSGGGGGDLLLFEPAGTVEPCVGPVSLPAVPAVGGPAGKRGGSAAASSGGGAQPQVPPLSSPGGGAAIATPTAAAGASASYPQQQQRKADPHSHAHAAHAGHGGGGLAYEPHRPYGGDGFPDGVVDAGSDGEGSGGGGGGEYGDTEDGVDDDLDI